MPVCISNETLDRIIATTTPPDAEFPDLPLTASLNVTLPVAREINAALRELRRIRRELRTGKLVKAERPRAVRDLDGVRD